MKRLHTYLKKMIKVASRQHWTIKETQNKTDEILYAYGVRNKLPIKKKGEK